jgi:hypothetical protein
VRRCQSLWGGAAASRDRGGAWENGTLKTRAGTRTPGSSITLGLVLPSTHRIEVVANPPYPRTVVPDCDLSLGFSDGSSTLSGERSRTNPIFALKCHDGIYPGRANRGDSGSARKSFLIAKLVCAQIANAIVLGGNRDAGHQDRCLDLKCAPRKAQARFRVECSPMKHRYLRTRRRFLRRVGV